jgi:hypothetical protein
MIYWFCGFGVAWGPIFHQVMAEDFAREYLPHLSPGQKNAFVLGSMFIDGLPDKGKSHNVSWLLGVASSYNKTKEEWWFLIGCALHLTVDMAGHQGRPLSYLPLSRPLHYLAELIVCSYVQHDRNPGFVGRNQVADAVYDKVAGRSAFVFGVMHRMWRILSYLPLHKLIGWIESDSCFTTGGRNWAGCNLDIHMNMIKGLMWDSLCLIMADEMTTEKLGEIVKADLENIRCCL